MHRLLNNVASFCISFWNVKAGRLEMQGSKARGLEGSRARGSKARHIEYSVESTSLYERFYLWQI